MGQRSLLMEPEFARHNHTYCFRSFYSVPDAVPGPGTLPKKIRGIFEELPPFTMHRERQIQNKQVPRGPGYDGRGAVERRGRGKKTLKKSSSDESAKVPTKDKQCLS